ncbi:MAG: VOC family protein [Burkholderiales bacterium]|nr:VOC family protein [Burkholderiales bacterium]PZN06373.1 MAG: glyoxalase [Pseudomonadota bacterium]
MGVRGMDHFTVLAADLEATRAFYCDLLGLRVGPRPPFSFPGLWLYAGEQAVLHVIGGREAPAQAGVIDHVAFRAEGLRELVSALRERSIRYSLNRMPDGGWQLFCRDPDGARIELDFDAHEAAPEA